MQPVIYQKLLVRLTFCKLEEQATAVPLTSQQCSAPRDSSAHADIQSPVGPVGQNRRLESPCRMVFHLPAVLPAGGHAKNHLPLLLPEAASKPSCQDAHRHQHVANHIGHHKGEAKVLRQYRIHWSASETPYGGDEPFFRCAKLVLG